MYVGHERVTGSKGLRGHVALAMNSPKMYLVVQDLLVCA